MLSTNSPQGISRRRMQHRRQLSTPNAFEMPSVRHSPVSQQQRRHNRSGMSLDLRGLNLESIHAPSPGPYQQEHSAVSFTNHLGQPPQQTMQVAQSHSQPQPGPREAFLHSPVQLSPRCRSPRTPLYASRPQSPQQQPQSPNRPPTEQQLKDLHEHIQSVYGSCGQVFINILPTPAPAATQAVIPEKPAQLPSHQSFGMAPHPTNFNEVADINLQPTSRAMTFDFENPDADNGYDSSGYYTSDVSPSPQASPRMRMSQPFLQGIAEDPSQETPFSHPPTLLPALDPHMSSQGMSNGLSLPVSPFEEAPMYTDLEIDASLEYTGIAPEEVQRYISEQDPKTNKWMCLYQDCGKVFGRRENIRSHVQTHLGDRQYKCNGCGKCFVRQHDLKRHAKIHTGNKPYKCPCGAGFARQDALTRHRQRGMCVGGFADAVRRQAKRGRPKKHRPEMEERVEKASRTRRALVSASSSVSASSPCSDTRSPYEPYESTQSQLHSETGSFNEPTSAPTDPFSFEPQSSPYHEETNEASFTLTTSYAGEVASMNLLQQLSDEPAQTPPLSPADYRPRSRESTRDRKQSFQPSPLKVSDSPSRSSVQSQQFTTPPTSPVEPKDELEDLFDIRPEPSFSQFDLEMRAMSDFTAGDSNSYDFLDFAAV
ncbi:Metallothionein expression activator [Ascochyta rabiei]|uniref:Metallothionein expression activator n=1 Tax=Didymella rabiei TaxID=5454 RepID=UPI0021FEAC7B|nr:Metallothionein expression activator [Ascochyta rabiei]UPX10384.1 Metallothionein expression activator [Ascochyta rabiei]